MNKSLRLLAALAVAGVFLPSSWCHAASLRGIPKVVVAVGRLTGPRAPAAAPNFAAVILKSPVLTRGSLESLKAMQGSLAAGEGAQEAIESFYGRLGGPEPVRDDEGRTDDARNRGRKEEPERGSGNERDDEGRTDDARERGRSEDPGRDKGQGRDDEGRSDDVRERADGTRFVYPSAPLKAFESCAGACPGSGRLVDPWPVEATPAEPVPEPAPRERDDSYARMSGRLSR